MCTQVKIERVKKNLKAYKVAGLVGLHPRYWQEVEDGKRKPSPEVAARASEIFGVPAEELFIEAK